MQPQDPVQPTEDTNVTNTPEVPTTPPVEPTEAAAAPVVETMPTVPGEPVAPEQPVQAMPPAPAPLSQQPAPMVASTPPSGGSKFGALKSKKTLLLVAVVAPLLLLGSGAAAYFGVVVPNKPENVLKSAFENALKTRHFTYDGTLETEASNNATSSTPATTISFKGGSDLDTQASDVNVEATVSGITIKGEVRYIDQNAYIKLGDLSSLKPMIEAFSPSLGSATSKIQNQWIEIDKTLIKQANADCVLDTKIAFTDDDMKALEDAYSKNQFVTVQSHTKDKVNNKSATKYDLSINDDKLADYAGTFKNVSFVKKLSECSKSKDLTSEAAKKDGDTTPISIWIDGSRRIVKVEAKSTDQDAKKDNFKGSLSVVLGYDEVKVEKPANAKPIMTLLAELQGQNNSLLGGSGGSFSSLSDTLNLKQL